MCIVICRYYIMYATPTQHLHKKKHMDLSDITCPATFSRLKCQKYNWISSYIGGNDQFGAIFNKNKPSQHQNENIPHDPEHKALFNNRWPSLQNPLVRRVIVKSKTAFDEAVISSGNSLWPWKAPESGEKTLHCTVALCVTPLHLRWKHKT